MCFVQYRCTSQMGSTCYSMFRPTQVMCWFLPSATYVHWLPVGDSKTTLTSLGCSIDGSAFALGGL